MSLNIEVSKDNYKILKVEEQGKSQYIGSKYCQEREIKRFVDECLKEKFNSIFFVFGIGFTEHIKELLKYIGNESKILIIELNKELINYCKNDVENNMVISDPRIFIASTHQDVKRFYDDNIDEINISTIKLKYYCKYDRIYGNKLQEIYSVIKNETERITTNRNTILHFGEQWVDCILKNLKYISKGTPVNNLKDVYKNVPAIIVSAGPSLEKNIAELKGFSNGIIMSGGRTLRPLLENNINPSLLCVMDSGEVSYKLVSNYLDKINCPLVFSESSNARVIEEHRGNKIFSSNNEFINKICGREIQSLSAGGSVSHSMTLLALYMGCNPIIFIGQDLAYTGEQGHALSAENSWQNMTFDDYKRNDDIYVKDIYGNPVRTSMILNRYRVAMENIIRAFPSVKFINATEGGANIEGTFNESLKDVLLGLKEVSFSVKDIESEDNSTKLIYYINELINNIDEYKKLYENREKYVCETESIDMDLVNGMDNELNNVIKHVAIIKDLVLKCRYDVNCRSNYDILYTDSESEKTRKIVEKNSLLYNEILLWMLKIRENIISIDKNLQKTLR